MEAPEQIIRSSLTDAVLVLWREDNDGKCSFCLQVVDTHITVQLMITGSRLQLDIPAVLIVSNQTKYTRTPQNTTSCLLKHIGY